MEAFLSSISDSAVRRAIKEDGKLAVCKTCGAQFSDPHDSPEIISSECVICVDPRQAVPESGQEWTAAQDWLLEEGVTSRLEPEGSDGRVYRIIVCGVLVGIMRQTPLVIVTKHGVLMWDCCAVFTPETFAQIRSLAERNNVPLLGIAISHPHFYTTSLTWAKALDTRIFISDRDREWWLRHDDKEAVERHVVAFPDTTYEVAPGLTIIHCGGHFEGSTVLHWDRAVAGSPDKYVVKEDAPLPQTGAMFCSDTFAPGMDRKTITFMWAFPNFIPLKPDVVAHIWEAVKPYAFDDIIGSFAARYIRGNARDKLLAAAKHFIAQMGHEAKNFIAD